MQLPSFFRPIRIPPPLGGPPSPPRADGGVRPHKIFCISTVGRGDQRLRQDTWGLPYKPFHRGDPCGRPSHNHRTPCKNLSLRSRCAHRLWQSVLPAPDHASGGILSVTSDRKYPKNAAKPKVLKSFLRLRCRLHRLTFAPRIGISKFHVLLSHCLCV